MCVYIYIQTSHKISNFFSSINIFMNYFYLYLFFLLIYSFDIFYTITTKYCYKGTTARHMVCAVCVV